MTAPSTSLRRRPALDGLRGLAVIGVLAYHHGTVPGGFLGVSAFFTLSGFLITWLLATEHTVTGRIDLRRFWTRRLRRLVPVSWLVLLAVLGLTAAGAFGAAARVHQDVLGALANAANWWFLADGASYGDQFAAPSPVAHYWSLAIEEQVYLLLPLLLAGVLAHRNLRLLVVAALVAGSVAVTVLTGAGDRAYFGTDTRAAEVLVGALAALVVTDPRFRPGPVARRIATSAGTIGLLALAVLWWRTELYDAWLYRGGFALHAAFVVAVIAAALAGGPARFVLTRGLLVRLGAISYGVYLVHWPVFLVVDADRVPQPLARLALRISITLVVAALSYAVVEQPIRRGRALAPPVGRRVLAAAALVLVVATGAVGTQLGDRPTVTSDIAAAEAALRTSGVPVAPSAPALQPSADRDRDREPGSTAPRPSGRDGNRAARTVLAPVHPGPLRVAVFGDSTALMTAAGLKAWTETVPDTMTVSGDPRLGCPVVDRGLALGQGGQQTEVLASCTGRDSVYRAHLEATPADVAVLQYGPWDAAERMVPPDEQWRHLGDPVYDAVVKQEIAAATDALVDLGVDVVWLTAPDIDVRSEDGRVDVASEDSRLERFNQLVHEAVAERTANARVVDLAAYLAAHPDGAPRARLRPDGIHFSPDAAREVATDWLAAALLDAAGSLRSVTRG